MNTKEKIVAAAIEDFAEKGKHGSTMDEIAKKAKVNKAMLYYFFSTKENIYIQTVSFILKTVIVDMFEKFRKKLQEIKNPVEIIKLIVKIHLKSFSENMNHTKILLEALIHNPDEVKKAAENLKIAHFSTGEEKKGNKKLIEVFEMGIKNGFFRNINPTQTMISIMGMILIYFISKPISQAMLDIDVKNEKSFLEDREESIIDLILYGIMAKRSGNE
jgi:TetR/AcrR family transcriptional regulator